MTKRPISEALHLLGIGVKCQMRPFCLARQTQPISRRDVSQRVMRRSEEGFHMPSVVLLSTYIRYHRFDVAFYGIILDTAANARGCKYLTVCE